MNVKKSRKAGKSAAALQSKQNPRKTTALLPSTHSNTEGDAGLHEKASGKHFLKRLYSGELGQQDFFLKDKLILCGPDQTQPVAV